MSVTVPNALALAGIVDGSSIVASDHRNNYSAVQVGVNGMIAMFTAAATKGDLIISAGGGSFDKLAVGTNGQAVVADSTQPLGVKWAPPPGYEYGYTEFAANVSVTATVEASANTVVTAPAIAFDGSTSIIVEFFTPELLPDTAAAGRRLQVALFDGSTSLGFLGTVYSQVIGVNHFTPALLRRKLTPAAATKTYSIRAIVSAGTGTVGAGAGAAGNDNPGYIRITKA